MKPIVKASAALAIIMTAAAGATAQESSAEKKQFDGLYAGVELGASYLDLNGGDQAGLYYGGLVGWRRQVDSGFVFGLEGTFGTSDNSFDDNAGFTTIAPLDFDHQWSVAATIGKAFGNRKNNLVFAKIGYQENRYSFDLDDAPAGLPDAFLATFKNDGLLLGAGYERALSDLMSLRLATDYADNSGSQQWQTKLGLVFKF